MNLSIFRLGIIDLGTVALRLDVYQLSPGKEPELIHKYRALPRLGEVLADPVQFRNRVLSEIAKAQTEAGNHDVDELIVVGTMAMRRADGAEHTLHCLESELGVRMRVVSGEEEARLTAMGILGFEKNLPDKIALVDIGGGSTEVSFCTERQVKNSKSYNVGVLTVKETPDFLDELSLRAREFSPTLVLGSSGTIRAIERLFLAEAPGTEGESYHVNRLSKLCQFLSGLSYEKLLLVAGVEKNRADILLPGIRLFTQILQGLGVQEFRVTHYSLRHGILAEWRKLNEPRIFGSELSL